MSMHWPECDSTPRGFITPGVPPNPLPFWEDFPLQQKLPVPSKPPKGVIELYSGRMGYSRWKSNATLDFDLYDMNNYKYPASSEYDSLFDRHLRGYLASHRVQKLLRRRGLTHHNGSVKTELAEYNRYRKYLHEFQVRMIKTKRGHDEHRLVRELMSTTMESVEITQEEDEDLRIQYSGILRTDAKPILENNDEELVNTLAKQGYTSGERRWLRWFNRLLQEDARKIALLRLRRIQKFRDSVKKRWDDWRRRNIFDMEWLAEEKLRREELDVERAIHVKQLTKLAAARQGNMQKRIDDCSELKRRTVERASLAVQRRVCIKSHRQWPLSARCPKDVLKGIDKPCHLKDPWETSGIIVSDIFSDVKDHVHTQVATPASERQYSRMTSEDGSKLRGHESREEHRESGAQRHSDQRTTSQSRGPQAGRSGSKTKILVQHVVKRAIQLVSSGHGAARHLDHTGPHVDPSTVVERIESAVRDEAGCLIFDTPDVQLAIPDYITEVAVAEKADAVHQHEKLSDWDAAPALRSSASAVGLYVANAINYVAGDLQDDGLVTSGMREAAASTCVARAATDATLHPDVVAATHGDGGEMMKLAVRILRDRHQTLPNGNSDRNWDQLGAGLVASLVRVAIVEVRDALQRGLVGDAELGAMAEAAGDFGSIIEDPPGHHRDSQLQEESARQSTRQSTRQSQLQDESARQSTRQSTRQSQLQEESARQSTRQSTRQSQLQEESARQSTRQSTRQSQLQEESARQSTRQSTRQSQLQEESARQSTRQSTRQSQLQEESARQSTRQSTRQSQLQDESARHSTRQSQLEEEQARRSTRQISQRSSEGTPRDTQSIRPGSLMPGSDEMTRIVENALDHITTESTGLAVADLKQLIRQSAEHFVEKLANDIAASQADPRSSQLRGSQLSRVSGQPTGARSSPMRGSQASRKSGRTSQEPRSKSPGQSGQEVANPFNNRSLVKATHSMWVSHAVADEKGFHNN